jgi:AraC-like DNA-binding protein
MLADSAAAIGQIARNLGYSDPAHFTRAFQRWTGCTPRDFRDRRAVSEVRRLR